MDLSRNSPAKNVFRKLDRDGVNKMEEKRLCPICGEEFDIPKTRKNQMCCSRECGYEWRKHTKDLEAAKRVLEFEYSMRLANLTIHDVLEGRLKAGSTNNVMTVTGARAWEGKKFIVLVVE
jgi:ribosomal protein L37AE/L43A